MRYSQLFGKTLREAPADAETASHKLLVRGGFIDQLAAGIYTLLPLGLRVHRRIENIIREEMDAIGGQEVFLPTLQPKTLWEETNRWNHMDPPLFTLKDRHKKELTIAPTHEEVITDLVRRFAHSYKDLPLYLYQIQNKFRNEMRSTGGLLRVREFMMKDLYSFHAGEADLDDYYQKVLEAYLKIFSRCGLRVKVAEASGGTIGGKITHEFHCLAETGEDKVLYCGSCNFAANVELRGSLSKCPRCGGRIFTANCIENGHIFKLGTKYSKAMGAAFANRRGEKELIWMGCYGIGIGRLLTTVVEAHHDEKGIVWPESVAPFKVHLIKLRAQSAKLKTTTQKLKLGEVADQVYSQLRGAGIEVLYDDREEVSAGVKFNDADLIGLPWRVVVSTESLRKGGAEVKKRGVEGVEVVSLDELPGRIRTSF